MNIYKEIKMNIRVYYEDTDIGGVMYYANYLKFIERARSEIFFERGLSPISQEGAFVVRSLSAEYLKPARFGDMLEIKTTPIEIKAASLTLFQEIFRDGEKLFEAKVKLAFLRDNKPTKIPQQMALLFGASCERSRG